jgi:hypothetical protein
MYRQLYDVEERGKTLDPQGLFELRQRDAVPIWNRFDGCNLREAVNPGVIEVDMLVRVR